MEALNESEDWIPVPDAVAIIIGRITFYAAWLDDTLGEVVTGSSLHLSDASETTPGWAGSGKRLVAALRRIDVGESIVSDAAHQIADHLEDVNGIRNQLLHGVWLWESDSVMVMKRSLDPGQRSVDYARYTYVELLDLVSRYRALGKLAERFAELLRKGNPVHELRERALAPHCAVDEVPLHGALVDNLIVWQCKVCGLTQPSTPNSS